MNLIISFSGRENGNCDQIARYISSTEDRIVHFRTLSVHPCSDCQYECFSGECKYRSDDIYDLYGDMLHYDKVILIVPMYCSNPCSLYFVFNERCQDYFMHNDTYSEIVDRLYIIGVYGSRETFPDFIPCFEKWFDCSMKAERVLGIERHLFHQKINDQVLDIQETRYRIHDFVHGKGESIHEAENGYI